MKKFLLAIVAALALSTGSTQAFRDTPQTADEFRALDPEPAHYATSLMSGTAVVGGANDATQTMQPAQALSVCTGMTSSGLWQWGKWAVSLPSYVLNPFAYATSWTTSKMLTQIFKIPGIRNYLGEKTAAFAGSIMGLATIYVFNPFGLSTQMLTTLHVLLSVSFGMDIFERLCSLTAAMLKHEWKIAGMELAASVIVGLLIFDAFGIRSAMSNSIAKGTNATINAAKQNLLNPLLDKLSTSGYERAHAVANRLFSMFGYETNLHNCLRTTGFDAGRCAKLIPQPPVDNSMALITVAQPTTPMHECPVQTERSRALTVTQPTEWHSEALQKSTDRINQVRDCVATKGLPSGTCAAQAYPSAVQTPGYWARFKSLFSWSTKPTPTKPSTFVQDANQCMKNTGLDVNACVDMASTVNMQGNQCPAYTTNACIKPVVTVATTKCEAPVIVSKLYAQTKPAAAPKPMAKPELQQCPSPKLLSSTGQTFTYPTCPTPNTELASTICQTYDNVSATACTQRASGIHCIANGGSLNNCAAIENNQTQSFTDATTQVNPKCPTPDAYTQNMLQAAHGHLSTTQSAQRASGIRCIANGKSLTHCAAIENDPTPVPVVVEKTSSAIDATTRCMQDTKLPTCPKATFNRANGIASMDDRICFTPRRDFNGHMVNTCYEGGSSEPIHCCIDERPVIAPNPLAYPTCSKANNNDICLKNVEQQTHLIVPTPVVEKPVTQPTTTTAKHAVRQHSNPEDFNNSCAVPSAKQSMVGLPDGEVDAIVNPTTVVSNSREVTVPPTAKMVEQPNSIVPTPQQTVTQPVAQQPAPTPQTRLEQLQALVNENNKHLEETTQLIQAAHQANPLA